MYFQQTGKFRSGRSKIEEAPIPREEKKNDNGSLWSQFKGRSRSKSKDTPEKKNDSFPQDFHEEGFDGKTKSKPKIALHSPANLGNKNVKTKERLQRAMLEEEREREKNLEETLESENISQKIAMHHEPQMKVIYNQNSNLSQDSGLKLIQNENKILDEKNTPEVSDTKNPFLGYSNTQNVSPGRFEETQASKANKHSRHKIVMADEKINLEQQFDIKASDYISPTKIDEHDSSSWNMKGNDEKKSCSKSIEMDLISPETYHQSLSEDKLESDPCMEIGNDAKNPQQSSLDRYEVQKECCGEKPEAKQRKELQMDKIAFCLIGCACGEPGFYYTLVGLCRDLWS